MSSRETAETVDPVTVWREEIPQEFKDWLDENDTERILSRAMCMLELLTPQDVINTYPESNEFVDHFSNI